MKWDEVEKYLRQYVGDICTIDDSNEVIYIGADLPDEYAHSNYTHILKGANAKAKANAAQGLPELIKIADGKKFTENYKVKHNVDAMYGWYRYSSRFALPVFGEDGEIIRYNVFNVVMVIRHARDGKKYLYDIINIKRNEHPFPVRRHYSVKNPFLIYNINLFVNESQLQKWKDESCIGGHSTV